VQPVDNFSPKPKTPADFRALKRDFQLLKHPPYLRVRIRTQSEPIDYPAKRAAGREFLTEEHSETLSPVLDIKRFGGSGFSFALRVL
jgi:hypothetical protein